MGRSIGSDRHGERWIDHARHGSVQDIPTGTNLTHHRTYQGGNFLPGDRHRTNPLARWKRRASARAEQRATLRRWPTIVHASLRKGGVTVEQEDVGATFTLLREALPIDRDDETLLLGLAAAARAERYPVGTTILQLSPVPQASHAPSAGPQAAHGIQAEPRPGVQGRARRASRHQARWRRDHRQHRQGIRHRRRQTSRRGRSIGFAQLRSRG